MKEERHGSLSQANRYWPALDGMRALAVVVVMVYHWFRPHLLPGGFFGVDVFFTLSGFLITSLLIGEWDNRGGSVSLRNFYARRALRLLPALTAVVILTAVAVLVISSLSSVRHDTLVGLPWVVLYVANWARALQVNGYPLALLAHTWSLAVEEQFYLIWPLTFVLVMSRWRSRERLAFALMAAVVIEWVLRIVLYGARVSFDFISNSTVTHSDGLLVGCALAFWLAAGHRLRFPSLDT